MSDIANREQIELLARILDPDIFDETKPRSKHQAAVIQIAARQHVAYEGAERLVAAGVGPTAPVAVRRRTNELEARPVVDRQVIERVLVGFRVGIYGYTTTADVEDYQRTLTDALVAALTEQPKP